MPGPFAATPAPDLDQEEFQAAQSPLPQDERTEQSFNFGDMSRRLGHVAAEFGQVMMRPTDAQGYAYDPRKAVDTETLNQRYGVPGYLRFNEPTNADDAAWRSDQATRQATRDVIFSHTNPQPLTDFAAGLAGGIFDPSSAGLMALTGGLGDGLIPAASAGRSAEGAVQTLGLMGRFANAARVPLVGAIDNVPYVGVNAGLTGLTGGQYDAGDALRDIALGAVFHTSVHAVASSLRWGLDKGGLPLQDWGRTLRDASWLNRSGGAAEAADAPADPATPGGEMGPALEPNPAPYRGVPPEVAALAPAARRGAWLYALDRAAEDEPVDVGQYIQRELDTQADAASRRSALFGEASRPVMDYAARAEDDGGGPYVRDAMDLSPEERAAELARGEPDPLPRPTSRAALMGSASGAPLDLAANGDNPQSAMRLGNEAQRLSADTNRRFATGDAGPLDTIRPPGRAEGPGLPDLGAGDRGFPQEAGTKGGEGGDGNKPPRVPKLDTRAMIAADPALKAMAEDTARLAAEHGIEAVEPAANRNPDTLAEAMRAAAVCLIGELG